MHKLLLESSYSTFIVHFRAVLEKVAFHNLATLLILLLSEILAVKDGTLFTSLREDRADSARFNPREFREFVPRGYSLLLRTHIKMTTRDPTTSSRVCRLCLTGKGQLYRIFGGGISDLAEKIYDITAIEIDDISGVPSMICEVCRSQILVCHQFVLQCRVSDFNYKKLLETTPPVRQMVNDLRLSTDSSSSSLGIGELSGDSPDDVMISVKRDSVPRSRVNKDIPKERLKRQHLSNSTTTTTTFKQEPIDDRKKACPKCDRMVIHLKSHLHNMHPKAPRKYECRICGKIFKHQQSLTCHVNDHNGIKPYSCEHCGKSYSHQNSLYEHTKYHEIRYRCGVCDAGFTHARVMREHQQTHRPDGQK